MPRRGSLNTDPKFSHIIDIFDKKEYVHFQIGVCELRIYEVGSSKIGIPKMVSIKKNEKYASQ